MPSHFTVEAHHRIRTFPFSSSSPLPPSPWLLLPSSAFGRDSGASLPTQGNPAVAMAEQGHASYVVLHHPRHGRMSVQWMGDRACVLPFYDSTPSLPFASFSNFYVHNEPFEFEGVRLQSSEAGIMVAKADLFGMQSLLPWSGEHGIFARAGVAPYKSSSSQRTKDQNHQLGKQILANSGNPRKCKHLGRSVKDFDPLVWESLRDFLAVQLLYSKFTSSKLLKEVLLCTKDLHLAEASPDDAIWGVGIGEELARDPKNWKSGCLNVLGESLMKVRNRISLENED